MAAPVLFLTPFSGSPIVYANYQPEGTKLTLPTAASHGGAGWPNAVLDAALNQMEMSIPPPYVRAHVGSYNVVACAGKAAPAAFALTALADANSAARLVAGRAQEATVSSNSWRFFRFQIGRSAHKLTVDTTLFSGAVEVHLVGRAAAGGESSGGESGGGGGGGGAAPPSRSAADYTWSGRHIVLSAVSSPDWCAGCTYTIGVRGTTSARFSLVYRVDDAPIVLQRG
eukprot:5642837-Prymnesium_polylepis.1